MAPALTTEKTNENIATKGIRPSFHTTTLQVGRELGSTRYLLKTLQPNNCTSLNFDTRLAQKKTIRANYFSPPKTDCNCCGVPLNCCKYNRSGKKANLEVANMNPGDDVSESVRDRKLAVQNQVNMGGKANTATVAKVSKGSSNGTNKLLHVSASSSKSPTSELTEASSKLSTASKGSSSQNVNNLPKVSPPSRMVTRSVSKLIEEKMTETCNTQRQLDSRANRLLKRLRRMQSRQAISHTKQQLSGLVDCQQQKRNAATTSVTGSSGSLDLKGVENMSTAALVNYVNVWQSQKPASNNNKCRNRDNKHQEQCSAVKRLEEDLCAELDQVSGHLGVNLHHLERGLDSDATESSSGGESADEADYDYDWSDKSKPML